MNKNALVPLLDDLRALILKSRPAYRDFLGEVTEAKTTKILENVVLAENEMMLPVADTAFSGFIAGEAYRVVLNGEEKSVVAKESSEEDVILSNAEDLSNLPNDFWAIGYDFVEGKMLANASGTFLGATISVYYDETVTTQKWSVKKLAYELLPDRLLSALSAATNTARKAQATASNAANTASKAANTASKAQATADDAKTTANNAQTTANNAKSEALDLAARMFGHTSVVDNAFYRDETLSITSLPACIESIGNYAFASCTNLALTSLPSGLTSIGDQAFASCTNLALTSLPSGLTSIGANAFQGCTNLALTSLPSGLTSIGANAFQGCTGLTSITFTGKPTTISSSAFAGCTNLTTINVPWAEGEVANAPWGATIATINYNYTEA